MPNSPIRAGLQTLVAAVLVFATGTAAAPQSPNSQPETTSLGEVSLLLGWRANGTFAPAFLAKEKGYFAEEGLSVEISEGGPGRGVELLANGQMDFFLGGVDAVPLGIQAGMDLRVVAVVAQSDPSVLAVLSTSPIKQLPDLKGKTVGAVEGGGPATLLPSFLTAAGLDLDSVNVTNLSRDVITSAFLAGRIDATTEFATDGLIQILAQDPNARYWRFRDFGVSVLSTGIVATSATIQEKPDVVRGIVRAILRAYVYSESHPEEAVAAASRYYPEALSDAALQTERLRQFTKLMRNQVTEANGIGFSTDEQWQRTLDVLKRSGGLTAAHPPLTYYTNEFLPNPPIR